MLSSHNKFKFDRFVQEKRDEFTRKFTIVQPYPESGKRVLTMLGLEAGGPGFEAIGVVFLEDPANNPKWYHAAALYVHPDKVFQRLAAQCDDGTIAKWQDLSKRMMQELNNCEESGGLGAEEKCPTIRKVYEMAAETEDEFARRQRHWHSLKMQYVNARVDFSVEEINRKSREARLSETEIGNETINDFVDRVVEYISSEDEEEEES